MAEYPPDIRNEIKVLDGNTFFISDDRGDVHHLGPYGSRGAAVRLGLKRTTVNAKIRKLGINPKDYI